MNKKIIQGIVVSLACLLVFATTKAHAKDFPLHLVDERSGVSYTLSFEEITRYSHYSIDTSTPWTEGISHFDGVLLKEVVLDRVSKFRIISVKAYNDYMANITIDDLDENKVILAWSLDGRKLSLRDKGPYWIVFDLDSLGSNDSKYLSKMVWQVRSIHVVE